MPTNEIIKTRHLPFIGHLIGSGLILNILNSIASPGMSSHKYDKSSRLSVNHKIKERFWLRQYRGKLMKRHGVNFI